MYASCLEKQSEESKAKVKKSLMTQTGQQTAYIEMYESAALFYLVSLDKHIVNKHIDSIKGTWGLFFYVHM